MRKPIDEYFLDLCDAVKTRSTCDRAHVGAIIVRNKRVLAMGYNGSPVGASHCDDVGHLMDGDHCIRTVHAEQNAICQASIHGVMIDGATLYSTMFPCYSCAKLLVNVGIKRVVCRSDYHASELSKKLFTTLNIPTELYQR